MNASKLPCPLRVTWKRRHYAVPKVEGDKITMPQLSDYADNDPMIFDSVDEWRSKRRDLMLSPYTEDIVY